MVVGEGLAVMSGSSCRSPIGACCICFSCAGEKIGGFANSASIGSGMLRYFYAIESDEDPDDRTSRGGGGKRGGTMERIHFL